MSAARRRVTVELVGFASQEAFWRSTARYKAFVGGIGSGKSFAGAVEVLRQPARSRGLVLAPTYGVLRDATMQTFFDKIPSALIKRHHKTDKITDMADGKRIYWRSADDPNALRGPNLSWLWVDEGAYVERDAWKVGLGRLRVDTYGPTRAWLTSTPDGFNWVWEEWVQHPSVEHWLVQAKTADNTFNETGYAERLAREYGEGSAFARQELDGEFTDTSGDKRLPAHLFDGCFFPETPGSTPALPWAEVRFYRPPIPGRPYVIGADPAEGVGGDDSAFEVQDALTGEQVCVGAGQWEPTEAFPEVLATAARYYACGKTPAEVLVERNNHGHAVHGGLRRRGITPMEGPDGSAGWNETQGAKAELYTSYASSLMGKGTILHDAHAKQQLASVDRATLKAPGKGKRTKVDDEATASVLANKARELRGANSWQAWS